MVEFIYVSNKISLWLDSAIQIQVDKDITVIYRFYNPTVYVLLNNKVNRTDCVS